MSEQIETNTSEVKEEPVAVESKEQEVVSAKSEAEPVVTDEPPAFTPEFKYIHKGKPYEVDEFFRPLIKDEGSQKRVVESLQKLSALEDYQSKIQEYEPTVQLVNQVQQMYEKGDLEGVVATVGITDEQLFELARVKLERLKMPAEQRAAMEKEKAIALEKEQLMSQNSTYQQELAREKANVLNFQIDMTLARPEYQDLIGVYEKHSGKGSFRDLLIQRGLIASQVAGRTIPPQEVLASLAKEYGAFIQPQAASPVVNTAEPTTKQKLKIIPNVNGNNGSPDRGQVSSIEGLRKLAQLKAAQEHAQ